jgi:hypothetical protein
MELAGLQEALFESCRDQIDPAFSNGLPIISGLLTTKSVAPQNVCHPLAKIVDSDVK